MRVENLLGALAAALLLGCASPAAEPVSLGMFANATDVGDVGASGSTAFDAASGAYTITGSGHNMWAEIDGFHFAWNEMAPGDVSVSADVELIGEGTDPHRKAGVIIRAGLDAAAPYADVVVHGDGLTSMQYRAEPGGPTRQVIAPITHAKRVMLERIGQYIYFSVAGADGVMQSVGGPVRIELPGPWQVGLVVCAHVRGVKETAVFRNVAITPLDIPVATETGYPAQVSASLEVLTVSDGNRRVVRHFDSKIEAPNWSHDGSYLLYNADGLIWRIPVEGGAPVALNTGPNRRNNNDHGISPDGTMLAISDQSQPDNISRIYVLPIEGSDAPREVASHPTERSYWHAWTVDGANVIYTATRPELSGDYDIFIKPVAPGGRERNLTRSPGLDDGPDVSPDGQWIYFNSTRSGNMKIWRMRPDGSNPEQVTFEADTRDWFPHPSPDGRWTVFVSFGLDIDLSDHPPNRDVTLRLMPTDGSEPPRVIARLFGGQGTINVPSWSPDSTRVAFVSYRLRDGKPPVR